MSTTLGIYAALAFLACCLLSWRFKGESENSHGSARWLTPFEAFKAGLFRPRGIRIGSWVPGLGVFYDGAHAITFGVTGSGKGVSAILTNLLTASYLFLIDPGGENTAIAAKAWRARGVEFRCINVFGLFTGPPWNLPADGFNIFDLLDPMSPSFAADALLIAKALVNRSANEGGSTVYFKDSATTFLQALIIHIKTRAAPKHQNLARLYHYVNLDARSWGKLLRAMKSNGACGGLVRNAANRLERTEAMAPEEFSAIISTIQQDLSFLADPVVREKLSRSDVDFSVLKGNGKGKRGAIISTIQPLQTTKTHAAIPRLSTVASMLTLQRSPLATERVLFVIDEAAALGKIDALPEWLATLRKYRVSVWTIWQSVSQLVELYGADWQTIISNCGLIQVLGVGDLQTAQYTEKYLGTATVATRSRSNQGQVNTSYIPRPLVMADELLRLGAQRQIDFVNNLHPMRLRKAPYFGLPALKGLYHPNPFLKGASREPRLIDYAAALWGNIYYGLVWAMTPAPLAGCMITGALVMFIFSLFGGGQVR